MGFKLVRTDSVGPNEILLPLGTHLIGRGNFLDCEDKRISRSHGNLIVNEDSVTIESLHQNPCFWTKKGANDIQILKKSCQETLQNGDRFGLLPGSFWYEVLQVTESDSQATDTQEHNYSQNKETIDNNHDDKMLNETIQDSHVYSNRNDGTENNDKDDSELLEFDLNETFHDVRRPESPSVLDQETQQQTANLPTSEPPANLDTSHSSKQADEATSSVKTEPSSPSPKRSHSPDNSEESAKKIKKEPDDVKPDVMKQDPDTTAGPSNDQVGARSPDAGNKAPAPAPARERCYYAENCYRKNPQHLAQFAHPRDADWGGAGAAPCPRGAACRARHPRHHALHHHPPPPAARKARADKSQSEDDEPSTNLLVTGKRKRNPLPKLPGSDSEEDPYASDGSDEWRPPSDFTQSQYTESQD